MWAASQKGQKSSLALRAVALTLLKEIQNYFMHICL